MAGGDPGPEPGQRTVAPPGVPGETQTLQAAQLVESGPGQVGQAVVLQERFVINLSLSLLSSPPALIPPGRPPGPGMY